jgi:cell division septation protein DedD
MSEGQDTEITLGTGKLLGLFFGLVIVCAIFFGLGFSLGRNSGKTTLTMEETPSATLPISASGGNKGTPGTPEKPAPAEVADAKGSDSNSSDSGSNNVAPPEVKGEPLTIAAGAYTVQVAAVSKEEDAEALVSALKKKSYPVFIAPTAADKLYHVQIGPYPDIKDAEAIKAKLTGDGYNPIVKR